MPTCASVSWQSPFRAGLTLPGSLQAAVAWPAQMGTDKDNRLTRPLGLVQSGAVATTVSSTQGRRTCPLRSPALSRRGSRSVPAEHTAGSGSRTTSCARWRRSTQFHSTYGWFSFRGGRWQEDDEGLTKTDNQ